MTFYYLICVFECDEVLIKFVIRNHHISHGQEFFCDNDIYIRCMSAGSVNAVGVSVNQRQSYLGAC